MPYMTIDNWQMSIMAWLAAIYVRYVAALQYADILNYYVNNALLNDNFLAYKMHILVWWYRYGNAVYTQ